VVSLKEGFSGQNGFLADMAFYCGISAEMVWDPVYVVVSDTTQGEIHSFKVILYKVIWFKLPTHNSILLSTHACILMESRSDQSEPLSALFETASTCCSKRAWNQLVRAADAGLATPGPRQARLGSLLRCRAKVDVGAWQIPSGSPPRVFASTASRKIPIKSETRSPTP